MAARPRLEARSLSTVNYLAANPPQYPYHPELRESLTLYISRVPGTQDIILSTFRPHKKNVTGEDITNSLYYVHLDSPEDELLAAAQRADAAAPDRAYMATPPMPPNSTAQGRPATPTQPPTPAQYPTGQVAALSSPASPMNAARTPSPGKPGRRPASVSFSLTLIRRDPSSGTQCNVGKVSAFQTNVPTPESADPDLDPDNMGGLATHAQSIDIRLETSGYAKYRDMPSRADVEGYRPAPGSSFAQQGSHGAVGDATQVGKPAATLKPAWHPAEEGFSRQVVMSYGQSWKSNLKRALQRKDRPGSPTHDGRTAAEDLLSARPFHTRQGSTSTIGSVDSADGRHSPTLITHPGPGLKPKGYVFLSPWNGRCEFRTSTNGRSLKCRHILDPASTRIDPREVAQSIRDAQAMGRSRGDELTSALVGAKPVSELRFNLPSSGASRAEGGGRHRDANHLSAKFSKLLHHRSRSSSSDSDEDFDDEEGGGDHGVDAPMDLSLGREHAGGGSRGRRVKLGKLIIHDEGLKMLDLVVAANVGVWWTTWGRML
ncbi:a548d7b1-c0e0-4cf6-a2e7-63485983020f [Thermothielavioides terrestris]|uniref:A548d7b1-c0e0-4cf6-a2e7-63485983020f n=1 Tax=Thermothielavioides terrestris TaxID=2587410 RepID=A0A3S4C8J5_9PEZI|nr:a548d7b1-c0e0-4cf6-a2e7-63485983020f [Thermothielavioides terrestris]